MSYDQKSKNDYPLRPSGGYSGSYYEENLRERPDGVALLLGALILWSLFQMLVTWISIDEIVSSGGRGAEDFIRFAIYLDMALGLLVLVGIWGTWNWKKWGYQLLLLIHIINFAFTMCSNNVLGMVINGAIIILVYKVIGDIKDQMN